MTWKPFLKTYGPGPCGTLTIALSSKKVWGVLRTCLKKDQKKLYLYPGHKTYGRVSVALCPGGGGALHLSLAHMLQLENALPNPN